MENSQDSNDVNDDCRNMNRETNSAASDLFVSGFSAIQTTLGSPASVVSVLSDSASTDMWSVVLPQIQTQPITSGSNSTKLGRELDSTELELATHDNLSSMGSGSSTASGSSRSVTPPRPNSASESTTVTIGVKVTGNTLLRDFEASIQAVFHSLVGTEPGFLVDLTEVKSTMEANISRFMECARRLELWFIQQRFLHQQQRPDTWLHEDAEDMREEAERKMLALERALTVSESWLERLDKLQV